jgi:spore coat protein U-like protein
MTLRTGLYLRAALVTVVLGAAVVGVARIAGYDVLEAANTIVLQGTVAHNCTIEVTQAAVAGNLPLTTSGTQRINVGSVQQSCNKKVGYTVEVSSLNCGAQPTGAKVIDPASNEYLTYSVEFQNPTSGGSQPSVTGLLGQACSGQFGRDVSGAKVANETSTVYVNFTGSETLSAGTYQDTLTITMNVR